jgi:uncharacterized repeat protein (TIGR02543 family)
VKNKFRVDFDLQYDGLWGAPLIDIPNGQRIDEPDPEPERKGYTFKGWYRDPACTNKWDFGVNTITKDTILYAKWVKKGDSSDGDAGIGFGEDEDENVDQPKPPACPTCPPVSPPHPPSPPTPPTPAAPTEPSRPTPTTPEKPAEPDSIKPIKPNPAKPDERVDPAEKLSPLEALKNAGVPLVTWGTQQIPLYGVNGIEVWSLANLLMLIVGIVLAILLLVVTVFRKLTQGSKSTDEMKTERETDYFQVDSTYYYETEQRLKKEDWKLLCTLLSLAVAVVMVVLFLILENTNTTMVVIDDWTPLFVISLSAETIIVIVGLISDSVQPKSAPDEGFSQEHS